MRLFDRVKRTIVRAVVFETHLGWSRALHIDTEVNKIKAAPQVPETFMVCVPSRPGVKACRHGSYSVTLWSNSSQRSTNIETLFDVCRCHKRQIHFLKTLLLTRCEFFCSSSFTGLDWMAFLLLTCKNKISRGKTACTKPFWPNMVNESVVVAGSKTIR